LPSISKPRPPTRRFLVEAGLTLDEVADPRGRDFVVRRRPSMTAPCLAATVLPRISQRDDARTGPQVYLE
jgi:hypothetical protein